MPEILPQYSKDSAVENLVILPQHEFDALMEELEELEDIRLFYEVKIQDSGEHVATDDAFRLLESKRNNG